MDVNKININQSELSYNIASEIYDVSAQNDGTTFESLSTLLSSDNLSTLIPTAIRCGGMTIRFVQSSDNKYVQYRLMAQTFTTDTNQWQGVDDEPIAGSDNIVKSGGVADKLAELESNKVNKEEGKSLIEDEIKERIERTYFEGEQKEIKITNDDESETYFEVSDEGVDAKNLKSNGKKVVVDDDIKVLKDLIVDENHKDYNESIELQDDNGFHITEFSVKRDSEGKETFRITNDDESETYFEVSESGTFIKNIKNYYSNWEGKTALFYGDSVTEIGQVSEDTKDGMADYPFTELGYNWQKYVCQSLKIKRFYTRGIGSSTYKALNWGAYVDSKSGVLINRPYPFVDYSEMEEVEGQTKIHGGGSQWDRIKAMIPDSIRNDIDLLFFMFYNDSVIEDIEVSGIPEWSTNNTTDSEWIADAELSDGGDYDINNVRGAFCSLVMKLQKRCPNAVLVCGTMMGGNVSTGDRASNTYVLNSHWTEFICTKKICNLMGIPLVDNRTSGINELNRADYIYDSIHPYLEKGGKALARSVISGLITIIPNIK